MWLSVVVPPFPDKGEERRTCMTKPSTYEKRIVDDFRRSRVERRGEVKSVR